MKRAGKPYPPDVKLIIWDLDGTLYPFDYTYSRSVIRAIRDLAGIAVKEWGLEPQPSAGGKIRVAMAIAKALITDKSTDRFIREYHLTEHGKPLTHETLYARLRHCLAEQFTEINPELKSALEGHGVQQVVLTNADSSWAMRVLERLDILTLFNKDHIFSTDKVGGRKKSDGKEVFEAVLAAVNAQSEVKIRPEQVIMVEDRAANLRYPKEMGMYTVLLQFRNFYQGDLKSIVRKPLQRLSHIGMTGKFMHHVDRICETPMEFLESFISSRKHGERGNGRIVH